SKNCRNPELRSEYLDNIEEFFPEAVSSSTPLRLTQSECSSGVSLRSGRKIPPPESKHVFELDRASDTCHLRLIEQHKNLLKISHIAYTECQNFNKSRGYQHESYKRDHSKTN